MTVRVIQVGYGSVGQRRAAAVAAHPHAQLVAVVDCDSSHQAAVHKSYGADVVFGTDYATVAQHTAHHAVIVSTPNGHHFQAASQALEQDAHVLVEKPLVTSTEDAATLLNLAQDRILAVGANHQAFPSVKKAMALLSQKRLGPLQTIEIAIGHNRAEQLAAWCTDPRLAGGGTLMDNGSHALMFLHKVMLLTQDKAQVTGASMEATGPIDHNAHCQLQTAQGVRVSIHSTWVANADYQFTIDVTGEQGVLQITSPVALGLGLNGQSPTSVALDTSGQSWHEDTAAFIDAINGANVDYCSGEDGAACLQMIEAAYEHALTP